MAIDWSVISESNFYKDASPEEKEQAERNYFTANFGKDLEGDEYEKSFKEWKDSTLAPKEDAPKSEQTSTDKIIKSAINTMAGPLGLILEGADYLTDGEASKVFNTAGANTVNIVPELANLGIEAVSGKKDVIPTVKVASPDTEVGKVTAEVLPYLIPVGGTAKGASVLGNTVAGAVKGALPKAGKVKNVAVGAGERFGRNVQQSVLGAAAGNDLSTTEGVGEAVEDTLLGGLIGAGAEKAIEGALKAGSKFIKPGNEKRVENARDILEEESDNAAKIKAKEDSIFETKNMASKMPKSEAKLADEYEPVYVDNDSFDFLGGNLSDKPKTLAGYSSKTSNSYIPVNEYNKIVDEFGSDAIVKDVKSSLTKNTKGKAELDRLVSNTPSVSLKDLAEYGSSALPVDLTKLPASTRKALAKGSITAEIANRTSSVGKLGDAGILGRVRPLALKSNSDKAVDEAINKLQDIRVEMGDFDSKNSIKKLISSLESGKSSNISVEDMRILNQDHAFYADGVANKAANRANIHPDDRLSYYDKELAKYTESPSDIYNKAKGQAVLSESFTTKNSPIEDSGNLIASAVLGGLTGGSSTYAQGALAASKYLADRAIVNDVKRAAGVAVKGDNTRNAISNSLNKASETAQTPASLIARPSMVNIDDSVIEVDDSEFEQLIVAPESNSKDIIEVDDTEFESLINTPTDGVIEVDEDEFYRMSNPGEAYVGDRLYNGFKAAETGGVKNPWIRTMAQDKSSNLHSSAYGPAQVTYSLAQDYLTRKPNLFTDSEKHYLERFVAQGKDMIAYSQGRHNDKRFAYGAEGVLNSDADKKMYERVVKKMLVDTYRNNGNSIVKTSNAWRGLEDPAYNRKVIKNV